MTVPETDADGDFEPMLETVELLVINELIELDGVVVPLPESLGVGDDDSEDENFDDTDDDGDIVAEADVDLDTDEDLDSVPEPVFARDTDADAVPDRETTGVVEALMLRDSMGEADGELDARGEAVDEREALADAEDFPLELSAFEKDDDTVFETDTALDLDGLDKSVEDPE